MTVHLTTRYVEITEECFLIRFLGKWKSRVVKTQPRLRWRKDSKVVKHLALFIFTSSPYIWIYLWKVNRSCLPRDPNPFFSDFTTWWRNLPLFIIPQSLHWTNCFFSVSVETFWFDYIRRSAQRDFFIITFILFTSLAICILSFSVESLPRSIMPRSILVWKVTGFFVNLNLVLERKVKLKTRSEASLCFLGLNSNDQHTVHIPNQG